jgi:AcrR family transcriptional regulator
MGRKPTITRDGLLDVAEELVREQGGSALTIGALAKAAGISKGGVQYSLPTEMTW